MENFCNKVCIIQNGKVIETSEVKKLKKEIIESSYIFEVEDTSNINSIIKNAHIIDDSHFILNIQREEIPEVVAKLVNKKIPIYEVKENIVSLEEAFLNKTGGNKID